ncbi:MAG: AMP-binding protein [Actinomycetota bacterium]|nr:AMP-binding protein [Actinomycetota bacterium]
MRITTVRAAGPEAARAIVSSWDAGRAVLVLDPSAPEPEVERVLARVQPHTGAAPEVAAVVATSGTTGEPKGVELTWAGLRASAQAVSEVVGAGPGDRWLCCMPLHHVGGLAVLARSWLSGVPVTVLPRFDVGAVADADATLVSLVPTMARRLVGAGVDLGRFRRVLVGGGPSEPLPGPVTRTYGLSETWGGVVHEGHPLPGVEIDIGPGDEILVRGEVVMRGYRLAPEETAAAFTGDGWLRTGDAGALDTGGRLHVVDRLRDLVITGGVNVSPTEVEQVLATHPAVADVCVAGAADPDWGERVVAYVVAHQGVEPPTLAALRGFAAERLSAAKLPRQVVVVDAVPRTAGGKPQRRRLTPG